MSETDYTDKEITTRTGLFMNWTF